MEEDEKAMWRALAVVLNRVLYLLYAIAVMIFAIMVEVY